MEKIGKSFYWDETFFPWVAGWRLVELVTIQEAACVLTGTDPAKYRHSNLVLPDEADAMLTALEQAILLGRLEPFAVWTFNNYGDQVPVDEVHPHMGLSPRTSVQVTELVKWADAREVPHCWGMTSISSRSSDLNLSDLPLELRTAIEAFQAVRADPRATVGKHPKQAILDWLASNKPELTSNARERISTVANWQPAGGAPKTPAS